MANPKWFTWTVQVKVDASWIADGFDLDNDRAADMVAKLLPYAHNSELRAKVLTKPSRKLIRKVQGY